MYLYIIYIRYFNSQQELLELSTDIGIHILSLHFGSSD